MEKLKQTAVQYLMEQLSYYNPEAHAELIVKGDFADALKMEREQIIDAYIEGWDDRNELGYEYKEPNQYFTNTYQQP